MNEQELQSYTVQYIVCSLAGGRRSYDILEHSDLRMNIDVSMADCMADPVS